MPDGHTGKPVRGHSDDRPDAVELIRGRRERIRCRSIRDTVGLAPLIERTFRYAYLLATLKRDEMVDEGRGAEVDGMVRTGPQGSSRGAEGDR